MRNTNCYPYQQHTLLSISNEKCRLKNSEHTPDYVDTILAGQRDAIQHVSRAYYD